MIAMWTAGWVALAPQAEQRRTTTGQLVGDILPSVRRHLGARPWPMSFDRFALHEEVGELRHRLSEQSGDVLKPGDERRRHVDAGDEDESQMGKHRNVGGVCLVGRPARLAESDAVEPQK